jgi:hypothetical protein
VLPLLPCQPPEANGTLFVSSKSPANFCVLLWRFERAQFAEFFAGIWAKLVER